MDHPLTLAQTADLIARHVLAEEALFSLTGRWSAHPGAGDTPTGIAGTSQALFAAESAHHGWRAEQWSQRRVRSLPEESTGTAVANEPDALTGAVEDLLGQEVAPMAQLAVWGHVLAPTLAGIYRQHRDALAPSADGGVERWLAICVTDLNRGSIEAVAVLAAQGYDSGVEEAADSVRSALARVLGG